MKLSIRHPAQNEGLALHLDSASSAHCSTMVRDSRKSMIAAVAAQLMRQRQRARERAFEIRKLQQSLLATQSFFVLQAMANSGVGQVRRLVPRALGKWRGSTLSGYLTHDDQTYLERFRATRAQLDGLVVRLQGSQLDSASNRLVREIARRPPPPSGATASSPSARKRARTKKACAGQDAPTLRYKVALCMYALGHGGPIKVLADAASVGESSMRRYLGLFAVSVIQTLRPVYMPGSPFSESDLAAVQGQFASRRGFPGVSLAVDGTHIPFRPKNRSFFMDYRNFKGWTSILAVAFVDSYYRFFDVDVGYPGRAGDNTVLSRSPLMASIASEPDKWLGKGGVILGDSGASDHDKVFLNPYHCPTEPEKCWFNFCHSSTRFFVEQAFGIWKSRFRFLMHSMPGCSHKLFTQLVYASAVLHNYLIGTRDPTAQDVLLDTSTHDWTKFFNTYAAHQCPTCVRERKPHCVHQAGYRNGNAQAARSRKAPSVIRDALCVSLWAQVCHDPRVCRDMDERVRNPMGGH